MANDTSTLSTEVYLNGGEPTGMWINPRELSFLFCFPLSTEEEMLHSTCIEYYVRSTSIALSMPMMLLFYHSSRTELSTRQAIMKNTCSVLTPNITLIRAFPVRITGSGKVAPVGWLSSVGRPRIGGEFWFRVSLAVFSSLHGPTRLLSVGRLYGVHKVANTSIILS